MNRAKVYVQTIAEKCRSSVCPASENVVNAAAARGTNHAAEAEVRTSTNFR